MNQNNVITSYSYKNGGATYNITDNLYHISTTGYAHVAEQDKDFESERTGLTIAEMRASIKYYKELIEKVLIPEYKVYKHLYSCLISCDKYDEWSQEGKLIYRKYNQLEAQINELRDYKNELKNDLNLYIQEKDDLYKMLRAKRKGQKE